MGFRKILLPVDGSAHSDSSVGLAMKMAQDSNATIVLLQVRLPIPTGVIEPHAKDLRDMLISAAETLVERYRTRLDEAGIDHVDFIESGRVGETIVGVAKRENCDLIVMGSKGKSDLEGLILGSETHKVLHTTKLPVLVVK